MTVLSALTRFMLTLHAAGAVGFTSWGIPKEVSKALMSSIKQAEHFLVQSSAYSTDVYSSPQSPLSEDKTAAFLSLTDVGAAVALAHKSSIQALLGAVTGPKPKAGNVTLDTDNLNSWMKVVAHELRSLAMAFPGDRQVITLGYVTLHWLMLASLQPDADGAVRTFGMSSLTQAWWLAQQAGSALVRRVCEVGFNAGHSALAMLLSAPSRASLVSFDLGVMTYTSVCAQLVRKVFPERGRFRLIVGHSNQTIRQFALNHPSEPPCDLIFIDGGHQYNEAREDLLAMSLLAVRGRSLVVMDDVGCGKYYCKGSTAAWRRLIAAGQIEELGCEADGYRRWCWGRYQ